MFFDASYVTDHRSPSPHSLFRSLLPSFSLVHVILARSEALLYVRDVARNFKVQVDQSSSRPHSTHSELCRACVNIVIFKSRFLNN